MLTTTQLCLQLMYPRLELVDILLLLSEFFLEAVRAVRSLIKPQS